MTLTADTGPGGGQHAAGPGQRASGQQASPPPFTVVESGYHPGQVDQHFRQLVSRIRELESRLVGALGQGAHEISGNPAARRSMEDLLRIALDEIAGNRAAAAEDAARMLADARSAARQILEGAQAEADSLVSGARQQSDSVIATARDQAKASMDTASARSAAVDSAAGQRLARISSLHTETLRRLQQAHDVTGQLLAAEQDRGPVEGEVERAMAALPPAGRTRATEALPAG